MLRTRVNRFHHIIAVSVAVALTACAGSGQNGAAQAAPQPAAVVIDPAGTYEFATVVDGQTVTGTLYITGTAGAYTGRITTNMFPEIPIVGARVEDKTVIATGTMPDGELTVRMIMDGAQFTGNWALGEQAGDLSGKKLPK